MIKKSKDMVKNVSKLVAIITFLADLIAVGVFIHDLVYVAVPMPFDTALAQVLLITVLFVLAIGFLRYSTEHFEQLDVFIAIFSWLYVLFAAFMLARVSYWFLRDVYYSLGTFLGYMVLIPLITGLGLVTAKSINMHNTRYFAIPYMLVALLQILLWVGRLLSLEILRFNWIFVGNVLLLVFVGVLIFILIQSENWDKMFSYLRRKSKR